MQATHDASQLDESGLGLSVGLLQRGLGRWGQVRKGSPSDTEVHRQSRQPLLGPVMQVMFDAPPLGIGRVDGVGAGSGPDDLLGQLVAGGAPKQGNGDEPVAQSHGASHGRAR